ncbi:hypothetical protein ACFWUQ_18140, partial [Streptomyces sp. NPDC058662]|uniref:hypothetical protein n=1 Tax=Streptomyces sp. NPDC058662 TaxID=3346583 RepID=UPI003657EBFB
GARGGTAVARRPAKTAARKTAAHAAGRTRPAAASTPAEPVAEKAAGAAPARAGEPPLRELVLALLVGAAEPRMVSEVAAELTAARAGRATSAPVVRNTLEGLAKKGVIEKEHRQGSVMYTAPRPPAQEGPAVAAPTADAEGVKSEVRV